MFKKFCALNELTIKKFYEFDKSLHYQIVLIFVALKNKNMSLLKSKIESVFKIMTRFAYLLNRSLNYWGCSGFDGMSNAAGCMPSMSNGSRKTSIMETKIIDNNYSYRLAA